ncbi:MAG: hypothetical protein M1126_00170 [Candidatus Thermoplasmatota archaeon]|nr:hypothetical protein [Candidatus Thermoplasmatota archaeon]
MGPARDRRRADRGNSEKQHLARLRAYKTPGATLDGVLNDLRADTPPESSGREIEHHHAEPGPNVLAEVMLRRLREQVLRRA